MTKITVINESNEPIELAADYDTWGMTYKPHIVTPEEIERRHAHAGVAARSLFAKLNAE